MAKTPFFALEDRHDLHVQTQTFEQSFVTQTLRLCAPLQAARVRSDAFVQGAGRRC